MDPNTGRLYEMDEPEAKRRGFIPVKRGLTATEQGSRKVRRNSLCVCGSGKRMGVCCWKKQP